MEDNSKPKDRPASKVPAKDKIVELMPNMEVETDSRGKIIDLTRAINGTADQLAPQTARVQTPAEDVGATQDQQAATDHGIPAAIEKDVDAAFNTLDSVQSKDSTEKMPASDDLDDLTDMVDSALRETDEKEETSTNESSTSEEPVLELASELDEEIPLENTLQESGPQTTGTNAAIDQETDSAALTPEATDAEEDEILELTDMVDADELVQTPAEPAATAADEDEILELTDMVDPVEMAEAAGDSAIDLDDEDDDVIELTDMVDPAEIAAALAEPDAPLDELDERQTGLDELGMDNDQVIQLDSVLSRSLQNDAQSALIAEETEADEQLPSEENFPTSSLGMELEEETPEEPVALTEKEIEEAIERIIRTKYATSIEKLVAATVERVVKREIEEIKRSLMDDDE